MPTPPDRYTRANLFLIRIWAEEGAADSGVKGRGRVQRVVDGEVHPFDDWPMLIELLIEMTGRSARNTRNIAAERNTDETRRTADETES